MSLGGTEANVKMGSYLAGSYFAMTYCMRLFGYWYLPFFTNTVRLQ